MARFCPLRCLLFALFLAVPSAGFLAAPCSAGPQVVVKTEETTKWTQVPDAVDLPSQRVASGQVVWPDGTPVVGASVILTIDDFGPVLENKYQSLLETTTGKEGQFVFMGQLSIEHMRLVAAARPATPATRGAEPSPAWVFGQASYMRVFQEQKATIVLDTPLLAMRVQTEVQGKASTNRVGIYFEPLPMGQSEFRSGSRRTNPTHRFQRAEDMQRSALPKRAPWYQEFPIGKEVAVQLPEGRWRLWSVGEGLVMSRPQTVATEMDNAVPLAKLLMLPQSGLVGRVVSATGEGIENVRLTLAFEDDYERQRSSTDGTFGFPYAKAGKYTLSAQVAGHTTRYQIPVTIPEGGIGDYVLTMGAPGIIQGKVDPGWMRPGLFVALHAFTYESIAQWVPVAADGSFRIEGIDEGPQRLRLTAMPPGFQNRNKDQFPAFDDPEWGPRPAGDEGPSTWDVPDLHELFAENGEHANCELAAGQTLTLAFAPPTEESVRVRGTFDEPHNASGQSCLLFRRMQDAAWTQCAWIEPNGEFEVQLPSKGQYQV